jgi:hypothetical protein
MPAKTHVTNAADTAHWHALAAARRAIRAGDIVLAERWMRLAERHYRCLEYSERAAERWDQWRRDTKRRDDARHRDAYARYERLKKLEESRLEEEKPA